VHRLVPQESPAGSTRPAVRSVPVRRCAGDRCSAPFRTHVLLYIFTPHNGGMDQTRTLNGVAGGCTYHSRSAAKDRRAVIEEPSDRRVKQITGRVCTEVCTGKDAPIVEFVALPDRVHPLVVAGPRYAPLRSWSKLSRAGCVSCSVETFAPQQSGLPGCCGPTRTSSPLSAAQHWRPSKAMSRTNPTHGPCPSLPMAEARGFFGAFR
jgi:hypothetical protein